MCQNKFSKITVSQKPGMSDLKGFFLPVFDIQSPRGVGAKYWGFEFLQSDFHNPFASLADVIVFFSRLIPLFVGLYGKVIVRGISREMVVSLARQEKGLFLEVECLCD